MALKQVFIKGLFVILIGILDMFDKLLLVFGIKLCKITRESLLRGLPKEVTDEIEKPDIKPFFTEYLKAHEKDTEFSLSARLLIKHHDQSNLKMRMEIKKAIETNPQILEVPIKKPLFIIGANRTGTTYLQWMLSLDPQFRCPHFWECLHPCPPGPVEDYKQDPRYLDTKNMMDFMHCMTGPERIAAHSTEPDMPDECIAMWNRSFANYVLVAQWKAFEDYDNMLLNVADSRNAFHLYEYHKLHLQMLGWGHNMESKRFLLKCGMHHFSGYYFSFFI